MNTTVFACPVCGQEVSALLGPVGKPDEITPEEVLCPKCGRTRSGTELGSGWVAYQNDRTKRFYCLLDHLLAHDPGLAYGPNRITRQDFRNLNRDGGFPPPVRCAWPECSRLIYGKRLILTGPGEQIESFVVWVEEVWLDAPTKMIRVQSFTNTGDVARHLVEVHRLDPNFAARKAAEMSQAKKVVIEVGEGLASSS